MCLVKKKRDSSFRSGAVYKFFFGDADDKAELLKKIAHGTEKATEKKLVFECGCEIEAYTYRKGSVDVKGVKLIKKVDDKVKETIVLKGLQDFRDFLDGATKNSGDDYGNFDENVDTKGIDEFLKVNREFFVKYVKKEAFEKAKLIGVTEVAGLEKGFGRYKYIPIKQRLAEFREQHGYAQGNDKERGLECYASSLINCIMSTGLVNPAMERKEFEKRYTWIHGKAPSSKDGVCFANNHNTNMTLRGRSGVLSFREIKQTVLRFQESDWAKLMGMDKTKAKLNVIDLARIKVPHGKKRYEMIRDTYLDEGWPVQISSAEGYFYSTSAHYVSVQEINKKNKIFVVENDYRIDTKYVKPIDSIRTDDFKEKLVKFLFTITAQEVK